MARPGRFRGHPGRLHGILALLLGEEDGRDVRRGAPEGHVGLSQLGRAGKDRQEDGRIQP